MKLLTILAAFAASASAFSPSASHARTSALQLSVDDMAGKSVELGYQVWDPMGLADMGSEKTLKWFRASEIKHCRVAMLATCGWAHTCNGWGKIEYDDGPLGSDPWVAMEKTPAMGWVQIFVTAAIVETLTETVLGTHYLNTEDGWVNPLMFDNVDPKMKEKELKNGRLAMIGIFSFFLGSLVPGAVPLYPSAWELS
uniref:Plastid light harvesting protein n=1 Tax=Grammatophora oceanica TaxID=210454 RepID=A0A7S1VE26_9STRA|mmetsp:Transcript_44032/g.65307  ORF Transcript_44032/g.65307 Transcript_44032/m.65307 type:complete len:197 (+) Transcript_44032:66-656(+)|eukprot:CAMPEP_0194046538 /NCGR_PEP_ID=MMETSP0009_2-20130614/21516_1 /TAXON_ID=210454 /ORGANISM="Grammatophora oceanica, Strain CCMP 410" /LENGTH=196 /DNA_ID=CAMNT_0038691867 /DNA_START=50 /DNA_END=640 /DNA_ORIENTATION=+